MKKDYNKQYIFYITKCHKGKDIDIIEYMEKFDNKQALIKSLIRKEIENNGK